MNIRGLRALVRDRGGSTAVETALLLPVFVMMVVGTISAGLLAYAASSLHFAVEEAARCAGVNATLCPTHAATTAFARTKYVGPNIGVVFQSSNAGCGHTVTASGTFGLQVAVATLEVPLTAASCFPGA